MEKKRIQYYDSMGGTGLHYLKGLKLYLQDEAKQYREDATLAHLLDIDSWELVSTNLDETPQQDNGYDCGVFTSMNANFLGLGLQLRFTARNMTTFRAKMTLNILDGHVD